MRVRIRAGRTTMNANEYASLRLVFSAHTSNNANFSQVISQRDIPVTAPADKPQFIFGRIDFELLEQTHEFVKATLDVTDRVDSHANASSIENAGNSEPEQRDWYIEGQAFIVYHPVEPLHRTDRRFYDG